MQVNATSIGHIVFANSTSHLHTHLFCASPQVECHPNRSHCLLHRLSDILFSLRFSYCFPGLQVEPFQRGLRELQTDCMINGRRRDHGAERAFLEAWEASPARVSCQPLAYW